MLDVHRFNFILDAGRFKNNLYTIVCILIIENLLELDLFQLFNGTGYR